MISSKPAESGERARCQNDDLVDSSSHLNAVSVKAGVIANCYRKDGAFATLKRILSTLLWKPFARAAGGSRRESGSPALRRGPASADEVLDLQPGELVEIKSRQELLRTLDADGRHRGLMVMPEMLEQCGRRFRVHKRVGRMLLEGTGEMRRVKHTVLLEGAMCGGEPIGCDRSCFFFWREAWLKRVDE